MSVMAGFLVYQKQHRNKVAQENVSCRLKWLHQSQFAGMYAAQVKGFFQEAGIDCELRVGGQNFNATKLVAIGSDDFGVASADQVLIARSQGMPIVTVAVIFQESPVCFFSRQDSTIRKPSDFIGKKVAMQYGTNVRTEYVAMMKRAGIDMNAVVEVPSRYDIQPFLSGSVDVWNGYTINEPLVAKANGVPVNIIKPSEYGVEMYADCIITSERMIRERPELVRRFVEAVIRGWSFALSNREEAVVMVLRQDPHLQQQHERLMLQESGRLILTNRANEHGIGWMDERVWRKMLDELKSQNLLGPDPVVISDVYTNEFIPSNAARAGWGGGSNVH